MQTAMLPAVAAAATPGKAWYVLAGAIVFATVAAIGGIAAWLYSEYDASGPFLAPGRHAVELKKQGSYLVWNDFRIVHQGRTYDEPEQLPQGVQFSVVDKASGRELPVSSFSGASSDSGNSKSVAVAQFSVAQPGLHEVVVQGDFQPRVFSVGRNLLFQMAGAIAGGVVLVLIGFGAALAVAGWAFLKRDAAARAALNAGTPVTAPVAGQAPSEKLLTAVVYGLQIASFLVGITCIAGVIINYLKRKDVEGTWLESHFRWQIRTFWWGMLWSAIGVILLFVLIGFFVLMATAAWILYRAIKGWIALEEGKPMYA